MLRYLYFASLGSFGKANMKRLILYASIMLTVACTSPADPVEETPHVRQLNNDRLHSIIADMVSQARQYQYTGNADVDFASILRIHHQAAIRMAQREVDWGKDAILVNFAKVTVASENTEINRLDPFMHKNTPVNKSPEFVDQFKKLIIHPHEATESGPMDSLFAKLMSKQYESAISLCTVYLKYAKDTLLKRIVLDILTSHRRNTEFLRPWRN